jgi:1-acyl-sn-glycerol-3-phosphate acyltransferase
MNPLYFTGWLLYRLLFKVYFPARVFNAGRVPLKGPLILASNHASFLDPPLVGSSLRREINYLARKSLFRYPGVGAVLRNVNAVPVDRDGGGAAGLKAIRDRLEAGGAVILFPEGTRTRNGQLQTARPGVGLLMIKSEAPVIPVRVFGTYEALGVHVPLPLPHPVAVKFGVPLDIREVRAEARTCSKARLKEIYQKVVEDLMNAIGKLEPWEDKEVFP